MRRWFIVTALLSCLPALVISASESFRCDSMVRNVRTDTKQEIPLSVVGAIIKRIDKLLGLIGIEVDLIRDLGYGITANLDCFCTPYCCNPPATFLAKISLRGELRPPKSDTLRPAETASFPLVSNACSRDIKLGEHPLCDWPDACSVTFRRAETTLHLKVGLSWLPTTETASVEIITFQKCECNPGNLECLNSKRNHDPTIRVDYPIVLHDGAPRQFWVDVEDPDHDVIVIRAFDEASQEIPVSLSY